MPGGIVIFHGTEEEFRAYHDQMALEAALEQKADDDRREVAQRARQRIEEKIVDDARGD